MYAMPVFFFTPYAETHYYGNEGLVGLSKDSNLRAMEDAIPKDVELLVAPVCTHQHWRNVAVRPREHVVEVYDPSGRHGNAAESHRIGGVFSLFAKGKFGGEFAARAHD